MRWTRTLIPTLKEAPADARSPGHALMLRAGLIRQRSSGAYDFLPLGLRSLHKAAAIVREEMTAAGAVEVLLPTLPPADVLQRTRRAKSFGEKLLTLRDRHGRPNELGPGHEAAVTELIADTVGSYKQLPLTLFQIQTRFRDEERSRSGLLRAREFLVADGYGFCANLETLAEARRFMLEACRRIFSRCGLPAIAAGVGSGPIVGDSSHRFLVPCEAGEDVLVTSDRGNYTADLAQAATGPRPWDWGGDPAGELEKVHTPGLASVADVARFLGVEPRRVLKTLVFRTGATSPTLESGVNARWVVVVVRGDDDVNEAKLARAASAAFRVEGLHLADDEDVRARWTVGFVGPDAAITDLQAVLIVDPDAAQGGVDWAAGANEADYHVRHFNWFRECGQSLADPKKVVVADVRNVRAGDPSPMADGGRLVLSPAIEVGHVSQHGTAYAEAPNAYVQDEAGRQRPVMMACCEVGIGRVLAAAVEVRRDDRGIVWPATLAPYAVVVTPVRYDGETRSAADRVYGELVEAGIDVLLDDRDARPGAKFADADLIGFPVRLTIGERGLKEGKLELKRRAFQEPEAIRMDDALEHVRHALGSPSSRHLPSS